MNTKRTTVVEALRSQGDHDKALRAACVLPTFIDTERDAAVLKELGISPGMLDGGSDS